MEDLPEPLLPFQPRIEHPDDEGGGGAEAGPEKERGEDVNRGRGHFGLSGGVAGVSNREGRIGARTKRFESSDLLDEGVAGEVVLREGGQAPLQLRQDPVDPLMETVGPDVDDGLGEGVGEPLAPSAVEPSAITATMLLRPTGSARTCWRRLSALRPFLSCSAASSATCGVVTSSAALDVERWIGRFPDLPEPREGRVGCRDGVISSFGSAS